MIVVDLGCAFHPTSPGERSIETLIERYQPTALYGFDPWPELEEGIFRIGETRVVLKREAAWVTDGALFYEEDGASSALWADNPDGSRILVPTFDLARFMRDTVPVGSVLKMDIEGCEYALLQHLRNNQLDIRLSAILVEWHETWSSLEPYLREDLTASLRCPVLEWA